MFEGTVDGDARTEKWRSVDGGKTVGDFRGMSRGDLDEFCVPAVDGHTRNFLFDAEILIVFAAEIAFATGPVHPRNPNAVANFQMMNGRAFFHDPAGDFVPQDQ